MKKARDFFCENENCEVTFFEELIEDSERDSVVCPICELKASEHFGTVHGWIKSTERTKAQLKQRSKDHMKWCIKKGIHPNDTGYSLGDRKYNNRTRPKNKDPRTIQKFGKIHETWKPGKEFLD